MGGDMKLLFPSVIHEIKVKNFRSIKQELIDYVYDQQQRDPKGVNFSNMGGWQSQPIYFKNKNILSSTVIETLESYFDNDVLSEGGGFDINGLWININKKGDYNATHDHPNCHLAGVFWIKSSKECGNFECQSPHSFSSGAEISVYTDEFREKTNCYGSYGFLPIEGTIMLFPASINHRVTPNQSDEDRISSSFNIMLRSPHFRA